MNIRITFKNGEKQTITGTTTMSYPKVKTLKINLENGLCYCFLTKYIDKVEIL